MHTSAPPTATAPLLAFTGTLVKPAEARVAVHDTDGHVLPVICLDVELDNSQHTRAHFEQVFTTGTYNQAQAAAHKLKKGMRVTVQTALTGMRLIAPHAAHIHVIHEPEPGAPCPQ